jgi:hypothetical protein
MSDNYKLPKAPKYTDEQLQKAIELASKGEPFKVIIDEAMLDSEYSFWVYRQQYLDFSNAFEQARQEGLEHLADGLIDAHKTEQDVQRARLKSDNAKWLLSKRKPTVYGDKVDIHVSQTIDIGHALTEARKRALPQLSGIDPVEVEFKDLDVSKNGDAEEIKLPKVRGSDPRE